MQARRKAQAVLKKLNIWKVPVSVTEICQALGIEIRYDNRIKDADSCYLHDPKRNRTIIILDDDLPIEQQRINAAHEVGHTVLEHDQKVMRAPGQVRRVKDLRCENEADIFASELLVPDFYLRRYCPDNPFMQIFTSKLYNYPASQNIDGLDTPDGERWG